MFNEINITYQLIPEGAHQLNAADRAIQTFKHHLIAGLLGGTPLFLVHV